MTDPAQLGRIRELNDRLRRTGKGGRVFVSRGVAALGADFVRACWASVSAFEAFSEDNDPWHEHDFGSLDLAGKSVMWKIDYYDALLSSGSPDPSDPNVTTRVLTIFLAEEY